MMDFYYQIIKRRLGFPFRGRTGAEVAEQADLVTAHAGGRGAVRDAAQFILKAQGKWADIMQRYME